MKTNIYTIASVLVIACSTAAAQTQSSSSQGSQAQPVKEPASPDSAAPTPADSPPARIPAKDGLASSAAVSEPAEPQVAPASESPDPVNVAPDNPELEKQCREELKASRKKDDGWQKRFKYLLLVEADVSSLAGPTPTSRPPMTLRQKCEAHLRFNQRWRNGLLDAYWLAYHERPMKALVTNRKHVIMAYAMLWIMVTGFVLIMWRSHNRLQSRIHALQAKVDEVLKEQVE